MLDALGGMTRHDRRDRCSSSRLHDRRQPALAGVRQHVVREVEVDQGVVAPAMPLDRCQMRSSRVLPTTSTSPVRQRVERRSGPGRG